MEVPQWGPPSRDEAPVGGLWDKDPQKMMHFGYVSSKFSMPFRHFMYDIYTFCLNVLESRDEITKRLMLKGNL